MNIERLQPIRQYQKEDKPCIVLALTYSGFLEWTESQDEEVAKLSIYCSGDPFRQLVNKTPLCYGLVVLPEWYRAAEEYKEEVYNLLTQLGFEHQELKGHIEQQKAKPEKTSTKTMEDHYATGIVAIGALRYSMGRRTYATLMVQKWVKTFWNSFKIGNKLCIFKDVKEYVESDRSLGDDCDAVDWKNFLKWMEEQNNA